MDSKNTGFLYITLFFVLWLIVVPIILDNGEVKRMKPIKEKFYSDCLKTKEQFECDFFWYEKLKYVY